MRWLVLLAVLAVLGLGAWALLAQPVRTPAPVEDLVEEADPDALPPRPTVRTGNLTVRVSAPDGTVPEGAEVGYVEKDGHVRWLYARESGMRQFADAPLGDVEVVARAPGYQESRTTRNVAPGVPEEVRLVLPPKGD